MSPMGIGGVLLRWLSERSSGKASALREGIRSTAQAHRIALSEYADWDWMRTTSALGFLDLDLRADRWSAAPLVLTRLPHSDGLTLIAGARTAAVSDRLQRAADDWLELLAVPAELRDGAVPLPDTLLVQYDDPELLPETAKRIGARFVPCAALQLGELLPRTSVGPEAAPPGGAGLSSLERYDIGKQRFVPVDGHREDGLYRWRGADNTRLVRLRQGVSSSRQSGRPVSTWNSRATAATQCAGVQNLPPGALPAGACSLTAVPRCRRCISELQCCARGSRPCRGSTGKPWPMTMSRSSWPRR